ncbi:MAG: hypothetical protein KDD03_13035 [Gelidibacter sp.]|nr:hypothetical protein [Gelidibacter sp.]
MTTPSDIITMINTDLPTNGNNEITASVLRPILIAMVNQINDLVGDAGDLPIGSSTVIEAINNQDPASFTIHTGSDDPNDTPPSSYDLGDFYSQVVSSVVIGFFQYNGTQWAAVLGRQKQKIRTPRGITTSATVNDKDDVIVYSGSNISDVITLPDPLLNSGRVLVLVNISEYNINTDITYTNLSGDSVTTLNASTVVTIIAFGSTYQQINTIDTV